MRFFIYIIINDHAWGYYSHIERVWKRSIHDTHFVHLDTNRVVKKTGL